METYKSRPSGRIGRKVAALATGVVCLTSCSNEASPPKAASDTGSVTTAPASAERQAREHNQELIRSGAAKPVSRRLLELNQRLLQKEAGDTASTFCAGLEIAKGQQPLSPTSITVPLTVKPQLSGNLDPKGASGYYIVESSSNGQPPLTRVVVWKPDSAEPVNFDLERDKPVGVISALVYVDWRSGNPSPTDEPGTYPVEAGLNHDQGYPSASACPVYTFDFARDTGDVHTQLAAGQ